MGDNLYKRTPTANSGGIRPPVPPVTYAHGYMLRKLHFAQILSLSLFVTKV
jgi:hypothetical protein